MRAYIAHNMDDSEELQARLEATEGEKVAAQKLADEGVGLLRKAEEGKEVAEAEARQLAKEREVGKKKVKEEAKWLRQELQELQAGFSIQKEKLEVEYQKRMDDMFFYGY